MKTGVAVENPVDHIASEEYCLICWFMCAACLGFQFPAGGGTDMKLAMLTMIFLLTIPASTGAAHTYLVQPDGSGDFPTIQQAVDAAVEGDIIELGPGTFTGPGNRNIQVLGPALTMRSQNLDPANCTIDCQDAGRGFLIEEGLGGTIGLEGITITRGLADFGAGLRCERRVGPVVTACVFYRNAAESGGAVVSESGTFVRCRFVENSAAGGGGAFSAEATTGYYLSATFDECQFTGNTAGPSGGAIYFAAIPVRGRRTAPSGGHGRGAIYSTAVPVREASFRNCSFVGNSSLGTGGAITLLGMSPLIDHCTFAGNAAGSGGTIECDPVGYFGADPDIRHSIIAFSNGGPAVSCGTDCDPTLTCSDVYGNAGGDWVGCVAGQAGQNGNLSADPLFCDPMNYDYALRSDSPCRPENNPACGLVGAWPVGCWAPVPVRNTSWGAVKARFR
jgi:predicted outer membrane repeat protein